jgi:hypothetical protein
MASCSWSDITLAENIFVFSERKNNQIAKGIAISSIIIFVFILFFIDFFN